MKNVFMVKSTGNDESIFQRFSTQEGAMRWLDTLLSQTNHFSFLSKLNDIQCECNVRKAVADKDDVFPNKFTMPLVIVNLVLAPFGIEIEHVLQ